MFLTSCLPAFNLGGAAMVDRSQWQTWLYLYLSLMTPPYLHLGRIENLRFISLGSTGRLVLVPNATSHQMRRSRSFNAALETALSSIIEAHRSAINVLLHQDLNGIASEDCTRAAAHNLGLSRLSSYQMSCFAGA